MNEVLAACMYYEAQSYLGVEEFPEKDVSVWILGSLYNASKDSDRIRTDMLSRIWLTYRKNFPAIGETSYTTDQGWGCMLRSGQMVFAEALSRIHLGREWSWDYERHKETTYKKILELFEDNPEKPYSIHNLAITGAESKPVGQWHGPNTAAHVLRKCSKADDWNNLSIHIAMNTSLIKDELKKEALADGTWKPVILFIPLLLGVSEINSIYFDTIKSSLEMPQSLGIIGGRPNHSLYFVGYIENELICLDPHVTQESGSLDELKEEAEALDSTYHCKVIHRIDMAKIDPSLALCYICKTEEIFEDLCKRFGSMSEVNKQAVPFQIYNTRPAFMVETEDESGFEMPPISSSEEEEFDVVL